MDNNLSEEDITNLSDVITSISEIIGEDEEYGYKIWTYDYLIKLTSSPA